MTELTFGGRPRPLADGSILEKWWRSVDQWTLWAAGFLFLIGMVLGLAASPPLAERNGLPHFHYVIRQAVFGVGALGVMGVLSMATPAQARRLSVLGFAAFFVAIALLPWLGTDFGKGATRWYSLGFASFQPSEFLKPFFAVVVAWLLAASTEENGPPGVTLSLLLTGAVAAILALQPDFGQATLVLATWGLTWFVAGAPAILLIGMGLGVLGTGWFAYVSSAHFKSRIDAYLSPEVDPLTQLGYAKDAITAGGLFGVGVGEGTVKWSLPDAHTDFIIAVAAEEYGALFCLLILALFLFVVARAMARALAERDMFCRLAGVALAALFGMQALVNFGVAVRLFPAKGMTLPLVSYGGSSALAVGITLGLLLAMTRRRPLAPHIGPA